MDVSVVSATPVVDHEYTFVNQCWFGTRMSGPADSTKRDAAVGWVYSSPAPYGSVPHAIMTASLISVPAGATCKVSLVRGSTLVKGSVTTYGVHAIRLRWGACRLVAAPGGAPRFKL
mgnify:CR=1 FL=1